MNGCCLSLLTVSLVLVFLHFSAAGDFWTSGRSSYFCFWTNSISNGQTHYMFLHQTTVGKGRSFVLFDSIWNKENSLVECIKSNKHAVIKSFSSQCWKARDRAFSDIPDGRFNISVLIEPDGPCVDVGQFPELRAPVRRTRDTENIDRNTIYQNNKESFPKLKRSKRAWMIPGTLWCGSGNKASDFSDLGFFEETDKCCRQHDHCEQTITSFQFGFGIFNSNFFTLSHCDCDSKFRRCLHNANERISDMVGYGYFNVLKMRCFEFSQRMECAERTWWGMCKHSHMTTYALLRDATEYNSTFSVVEDEKLDLHIHHTVSFGDLTVDNDLVMSSDIVTEDGNEKRSLVTVPQWLSVTINKSQQRELHGKTVNTHTTDLSKTEKNYSEMTHTDSAITQTMDAPKPETIYSPKTETTDSTNAEATTDSTKTEATDSTKAEATTDSTNAEATTDSTKAEATDSSSPETSGSPKTHTTDSSKTEATDSTNAEATDSTNLKTTVPPKEQTTDSSKSEATDLTSPETSKSPKTQTTDSSKTEATESTNAEATESTSSETTVSPKEQTTDSSKSEATDSPKTYKTDLLKTQTRDLPETKTTALSKPQTTVSPNHFPEMHTNQKGKVDICESYKDLDSCRYQIPALREKFGLRNTEHTTMYHCNCTARLARELAEEDEADMVHFWLLDFISQSCFLLPQNCTGSESCSSSSSHDAPVIERWSKGAAMWRHLAAPRRKAKRFNNKRSRRKDSPIRMHKKCLRMHSKLHRRKNVSEKRNKAAVP